MSDDGRFLGVDGGGTKTDFICIDGAGAVIARATTGTTYHLEIGMDRAVDRLEEGLAAICGQIGIAPDGLDFTFFGLPAYGEDGVIDPHLYAACRRLLGHARYACGNDMVCGWAGSLACEDGINIVAGTGSIGYGERQGRVARAGGWGEIFGDEGSAYWIAIRGLALFSRMSDGRAAKGALHRHVVEALSLSDDLDLCRRVMGAEGLGRTAIADLGILVSRAAAEGDEGAKAILVEAARELAALATSLRTRLGFADDEPAAVSWSGGVLLNEPLVRAAFIESLASASTFTLIEPRHGPGYGAALYARQLSRSSARRGSTGND